MKAPVRPLLFALLLTLSGLAATTSQALAQRVGYVDTELILSKMPEYQAAQKEIELASQQWQKEYDDMRAQIDQMFQKYQAERVLLTDDIRQKREQEIEQAEQKAAQFRAAKFGFEGELFKLQNEKVSPIQDKVFTAIETVAKEKKIDIMMDKAGSVVLLYTNPEYDHTKAVFTKLGIAP